MHFQHTQSLATNIITKSLWASHIVRNLKLPTFNNLSQQCQIVFQIIQSKITNLIFEVFWTWPPFGQSSDVFFALRASRKLWITINSRCLICSIYHGHNFPGHLALTNFGCQTFVQLHFSLILAIHFPLFSLILNNFPLQKLRNNEIINLTKNRNLGFRYLIISILMTFYLFVIRTAPKSFQGLNLQKVQLVPKIYSHTDERLLELELTDYPFSNKFAPSTPSIGGRKKTLFGNQLVSIEKVLFKCKENHTIKRTNKAAIVFPRIFCTQNPPIVLNRSYIRDVCDISHVWV